MPRTTDTRPRIIEAALTLIRGKGYGGTTISEIVEASGAPRGSVTFHFRGGKEEIALEVVELMTARILADVDRASQAATTPAEVLTAQLSEIADVLECSEFSDSCPVSPITIELGQASDEVREACMRFFAAWREALTQKMAERGMDVDDARRIASLMVYATEGALVVCRAERSLAALRQVSDEVVELCLTGSQSGESSPASA